MPKLNIVWHTDSHHVRRYKTGKYRAFRLDYEDEKFQHLDRRGRHLTDYVDSLEYAIGVCERDLATLKGRVEFFYKVPPTPTHEVIENEFDGTT